MELLNAQQQVLYNERQTTIRDTLKTVVIAIQKLHGPEHTRRALQWVSDELNHDAARLPYRKPWID